MQVNFYEVSIRLSEISLTLHDLSRELELATCTTSQGVDTSSLRKLADSLHLESTNFRLMGLD